MPNPLLIVFPVAVCTIVGIWMFQLYVDYKKREAAKKERAADNTPCVCGHRRIYHNLVTQRSCIGLDLMTWCPCQEFKMNNLIYLEKLALGEHDVLTL